MNPSFNGLAEAVYLALLYRSVALAGIAQWLEHLFCKQGVGGPIPSTGYRQILWGINRRSQFESER